jgi:GGDEF domain-containing protein
VCEQVEREPVLAVGQRLQEAIRLPLTAAGAEHALSASIGCALGHSDPEGLLDRADTALYRAKAGGGGGLELYD